jgi:magnesium-transporting ATPase (P-type)
MEIIIVNGNTIDVIFDILKEAVKRVDAEEASRHQPLPAGGKAGISTHSAATNEADGRKLFSVVIDGYSLGLIFKRENNKIGGPVNDMPALEKSAKSREMLLRLGDSCKTVICCRVSPAQKKEVVELVRYGRDAITLSIGDGANDVSMIKTAHIGVGISGKEGMQAVMNSDYAIAQFRFLKTLLLVHGRWSYTRVRNLILFSFYKNLLFVLPSFWFSCFHGFSGTSLYDSSYIALYNVTMTSLPIMFYAVFDQDVTRPFLYAYPLLYSLRQQTQRFDRKDFIQMIIIAVIHSVIVFFVPVAATHISASTTTHPDGIIIDDAQSMGTLIYTLVIILATFVVAIHSCYFTFWNWFVLIGSVVFWFAYICAYNVAFDIYELFDFLSIYYVFFVVSDTAIFWLSIILALTWCMLPLMIWRSCKLYRWPKINLFRRPDLLKTVRERMMLYNRHIVAPAPLVKRKQLNVLFANDDDVSTGKTKLTEMNQLV